MARRSALGKGLGAFFGDDVVRAANETNTEKKREHSAKNLEPVSGLGESQENGAEEKKRTADAAECGIGKHNVDENNAAVKVMDAVENDSEDKVLSVHSVNSNTRSGSAKSISKGKSINEVKAAENENSVTGKENSKIQSTEDSSERKPQVEDVNVSRETFVKLSKIEPNEEQPRKKFDEESLQELADSIKEYGILQPLLVKKNGDMYRIIAGERRWRAAKTAGLKEVPVIIREYDRQQSVEIALIENVQRADLNPIEEAFAYQQLMKEFGLKQEEIASRVAKNRATITNSIRLLKLAAPVQKLLIDGQISSGHARALLGIEDAEKQTEVAKSVVEKGLSVREVEKLVKMMSKPPKEKKEKEEERDLSFIFRDLEERMKGIMGTKVMIHQKDKNKGRIEIEYYSSSELERIVELIESIR